MAIVGIAEGTVATSTTATPVLETGTDASGRALVVRTDPAGAVEISTRDIEIAHLVEQRITNQILAAIASGGVFTDDPNDLRVDADVTGFYAPGNAPVPS
jgi:hypothetical protein